LGQVIPGQNAHREWNFRVQIDRAAEGTVKALGEPTGVGIIID